jgi:DMSO reductase anchor subunit
VIAWRTSWLSREAIAFGGFAGLAVAYAATVWWDDAPSMRQWMGALVAISGLAGVLCSTMIYASTKRVFWNPFYTGLKFSLTCLILGLPFVLALQMTVAAAQPRVIALLCTGLIVASGVKLLAESAAFCWLGSRRFTPLRRTALLMTGELRRITGRRFVAGVAGGIALPSWLLATAAPAATPANLCAAVAMLALCLMGELFERYLFFSAVIAPKMPGSPAT